MACDSDTPQDGIPSWQRKQQPDQKPLAPPSSASGEQQTTQNEAATASSKKQGDSEQDTTKPDQETLMQQASRFLQDERIRDASPEAKLAFLESKGLDAASIEKTRHLISSIPSTSPPTQQTPPVPPRPQAQSQSQSQPETTSNAIPPIITYPEFLLHANKPPPLITARRLLTIAYAATGAAALVYGVSTYLVKPMTESLTHARHDFAANAQERVDELNEKLLQTVSRDPAMDGSLDLSAAAVGQRRRVDDDGDGDADSDSDPTELYHRDFGTQTADLGPPSARKSSDASSNPYGSAWSNNEPDPDPTIASTNFLTYLRTCASTLTTDHLVPETESAQEISTVIRVLNEYLESMAYPASRDGGAYGGSYSVIDNHGAGQGVFGTEGKKKVDEVGNLRAEIRSVKGVLLSARIFPGGGGGGGVGAGAGGAGRRSHFPPVAGGQGAVAAGGG